jgi:nucleoid DNA-binding protein
VNKAQLVKQVSDRAQLDSGAARRAVDAVIEGITERLAAGEEVNLTGFGKFSVVQRAERDGVNPREPGSRIRIPARRSPRFTPGTQLRTSVAAGPDGKPILDPVSLMANQPTVVAVEPAAAPAPLPDNAVELVASQSDETPMVPDAAKPKSGGRARSRKATETAADTGAGKTASKSSAGGASKGTGKAASKSSTSKSSSKAASESKGTTRRSTRSRSKES